MLNFQEPCSDVHALVLHVLVPVLSLMGDGSTALSSLLLKPTSLSHWMIGASVRLEWSHLESLVWRQLSACSWWSNRVGRERERWSMLRDGEMYWMYIPSSTFPYHNFSGCIHHCSPVMTAASVWTRWKLLLQPWNEISSLYRIKFNSSAFYNTCSLRTYFAYFE